MFSKEEIEDSERYREVVKARIALKFLLFVQLRNLLGVKR